MDKKIFIGMYHNDSELMAQIDELKVKGIDGENIYVIAEDESDVAMFQGMKYGDVQTTPESWFDRFMDILTGEDHVRSMLEEVGVPEGDMDNYYMEIKNGGKLLYVDQGELNNLHAHQNESFGMVNGGTDPNLGANRITDFDSEDYRDDPSFTDEVAPLGRVGGEAPSELSTFDTLPINDMTQTDSFNGLNQMTHISEPEDMRQLDEQARMNQNIVDRQEDIQQEMVLESDEPIIRDGEVLFKATDEVDVEEGVADQASLRSKKDQWPY